MKKKRIGENNFEVKYSILGVLIIHPTSSLMKGNSPLIQMILNQLISFSLQFSGSSIAYKTLGLIML